MRAIIAVAVGLVTLATIGCERPAPLAKEVTAVRGGVATSPPATADVVEVECSAAGTRVSGTRFTARHDGVHVRVRDTSGASGVYLAYRHGPWMTLGGGEPVHTATTLVLGLPPGPVQLNCSSDLGRHQDAPVAIEVSDPAGAWQTGALAALGCPPPRQSIIDWMYRPGTGTTPDAALAAIAAQLDKPTTWSGVQEGYVDSAEQTYVMWRAGRPWATAMVIRQAAGDHAAYLGSLCSADGLSRSR